jgi:hypothetical protein
VTVALTASGRLTNTTYGVQTNEVYTAGVPVAVEVLPPPCLQALTGLNVTGPTNGLINTLYPFTGTITPPDASEPIYYTWTPTPTIGQSTPDAAYQWATPGWYTLILRAENCAPPDTVTITATHVISINSPCPHPLTGASIAGPTTGLTDTLHTFSGSITPTNATQPITYTWSPTPTIGGQGTPDATYEWAAPGWYTLTLTAENCGGAMTAIHVIYVSTPSITCQHPLSDVSVTGLASGVTDTPYTFIGDISPTNATEPITYTWSPTPTIGGQGTSTAAYQWATTGTHAITLTAENCGGVFIAVHTIVIEVQQPSSVYLPVVYKHYPDDAPDTCPGWSLAIAEPFDEDFDHATDHDWFTFQATAGVSYTIRTQDLEIITLYNSTCATPLAMNDDLPYPSNSRASQIGWRATATSPLHVLVRNYDPSFFDADTGYSLAVYDETNPAPPIDDAPDFCTVATAISTGQPYTNNFDHANDNDWFVFGATAGHTYTITTGNLGAQANTILELWDSDCETMLTIDLDSSEPEAQIIWFAATNGQLRVNVRHYDWTIYGPDTSYTVTIEEE